MKKKNIINLIKAHVDKNEIEFQEEVVLIANFFADTGDDELAKYIMSILQTTDTFTPQMEDEEEETLQNLTPVKLTKSPLPLPENIFNDMQGIINAINHNVGINKFLFEGKPGTGKTESVKQITKLLDRKLFLVDIPVLIDCKLGQTSKNIVEIFNTINNISFPSQVIILFDELDALALDRINSNDTREMGRTASIFLRELDNLNEQITIIATTNLYSNFDKAILRRFDKVVNFDNYSVEELLDVADFHLDYYIKKFPNTKKKKHLLRKIITCMEPKPSPGELKNIIRTALAFSTNDSEYGYLKIIVNDTFKLKDQQLTNTLIEKGFTLREIEIITGISKSTLSRRSGDTYE